MTEIEDNVRLWLHFCDIDKGREVVRLYSCKFLNEIWSYASQIEQKGADMLHTEVKGLSVAYERAGDGPVLVLLHGFTQDSRVWYPQFEGLSDRFTLIAWDAPGAGQSSDPPESFGIRDWAQSLAGLLDANGVQQAHILGLSWGGLLAQEFYRQYSERVLSLVLADTYAGWKGSLPEPIPQERLAACLQDASLAPSDFVLRYLPGMFSESPLQETREYLATIMSDFHPFGFRRMATVLAQADTRDLLPNITVPTLLVWGDADQRSPMSVAYQMRDTIPAARLAVISGVGHLSNLEAPAQFNAEILAFCSPIMTR
jgi:pimeloyl-ACP methyl ester carboxylesterase